MSAITTAKGRVPIKQFTRCGFFIASHLVIQDNLTPDSVLNVVQTAAIVRHLVSHALPLGVGAGRLHAHLVHIELLFVVLVQLGRNLADETLSVDVVSHGPLCRPLRPPRSWAKTFLSLKETLFLMDHMVDH